MGHPEGENISREGNSSQEPFHNEFSQINSPREAEDVAYVEKDRGRDAAILRENVLREKHDAGLKNLELANMLVEKFPNAFVEGDDNGSKIFTTGLYIVGYDEDISEFRLLRERLLEDLAIINEKVGRWEPSGGGEILDCLIRSGGDVQISKYGLSVDDEFIHYKDSIRIFSDEELELFLKTLKFLDKVGRTNKERERKKRSVEAFRNLAQQIKNS
jgi:hypothetical protein